MTGPGATVAAPLLPFLEYRDLLVAHGWEDGCETRLADLLDVGIVELAGGVPPGMALVAIGGFGRRVMAIRSDVDLLFLGPPADAGPLEARVLRPLWDAHLKVGHVSHTPRDARIFAGTRLDAISTFLTARLLTGDEEVFADFQTRFYRLLDKEHAQIVGMMGNEEIERRTREPYRRIAGNLKTGRGGIRTLDMVDWRRRLFGAAGVDVEPERRDERLRRDLTRFRSALHAVAGRPVDTYEFDLRERAAGWLNLDPPALGRSILEARTGAEWLVDALWPQVGGKADPQPGRTVDLETLHPDRRRRFHRIDAAGGIAPAMPDWERLRDLPHAVPFHEFAVGDHILAAVDQAFALLAGTEDPMVREALDDLDRPERLVWAAWLHDVGKGLEGDHSRVGAGRLPELCRSLGLTADEELLTAIVENHLLLADLATRHDLDDPRVLTWAADRIGDLTTLRFLFLLTVADSRATGTDTWSPWRAELVRRAYRRMERELNRRMMPEEAKVAVLVDRVVAASKGTVDRSEAMVHLAGFGEVYRMGHAPEEILDHIRLSSEPLGVGGVTVHVSAGIPARVIVMATDRPRLLLAVAGVIALSRLSIVDARFATRSDGRVFDTFDVVKVDGGGIDGEDARNLSERLAHTIRRGFDLATEVAAKRQDYRATERAGIEPVIRARRLPDGGGIVEIECADRVGLLFDVAEAFNAFGMPVVRARIDTRGGVAYDSFHVDRLPTPTDALVDRLRAAAS